MPIPSIHRSGSLTAKAGPAVAAGAAMPRPAARPSSLLTLAEVADRLRLSRKTVGRLIERGELPFHRLGRQFRVSEDDLAVFLARSRQ